MWSLKLARFEARYLAAVTLPPGEMREFCESREEAVFCFLLGSLGFGRCVLAKLPVKVGGGRSSIKAVV